MKRPSRRESFKMHPGKWTSILTLYCSSSRLDLSGDARADGWGKVSPLSKDVCVSSSNLTYCKALVMSITILVRRDIFRTELSGLGMFFRPTLLEEWFLSVTWWWRRCDIHDSFWLTMFPIMFWQCLSVGCYKLSPGVVTVWVWPDWLSHCLSWLGCHGLEHYVTPSRTSNLQHLPSLLLSDHQEGFGSEKSVGLRRFFLYF